MKMILTDVKGEENSYVRQVFMCFIVQLEY